MSNHEYSSATSMPDGFANLTRHFKSDFIASLVVFLVALPLCIGVAVAVGVSPGRALISGIIGGLIVGWFAGSPLQVSGPAAGLFVIVADVLVRQKERFASLELGAGSDEASAMTFALVSLGLCVFLAGLMQVAAGTLRLGRWFRAVAPSVIHGMLAGIGMLIAVSQFHVMFDHTSTWHGHVTHEGWQYLATMPQAVMSCFGDSSESRLHAMAGFVAVITIVFTFAWNRFKPESLQAVPGALVGVLAATLVTAIGQFDIARVAFPSSLAADITLPTTTWFTLLGDSTIWMFAGIIAFVASADALLTAAATDRLARDIKVKTQFDRELTAQGVGNVLCGLLGALPITGVIVRSSANVEAGARTRLATIMHGAWLLVFVCLLPGILNYVPIASLGALLVYTGFRLLEPAEFRKLYKIGKSEAAIYLLTAIVIVLVDLSVGVLFGFALSTLKLLYQFSHLDIQVEQDGNAHRYYLRLEGAATFLRLPLLADQLDNLPNDAELHVCLNEVSFIDHACFELLMEWAESHVADGGRLVMDWAQLHGKFQSDVPKYRLGSTTNDSPVTAAVWQPLGDAGAV
ncbi:MAG: SulP family inorganic anion transporter [Planctomycetota bacterium]